MAFTESFTAAIFTNLESLSGWTRGSGTAGDAYVNSNRLVNAHSGGADAYYVCTSQGSADHFTQAAVHGSGGGFICVRLTDANNFIGFRHDASTGAWQVYKRVAGAFTQLGSDYTAALVAGDVGKLDANGDTIIFTVNGTQRCLGSGITETFNNTEVRQGVVARGTNSSPWIDDFVAQGPAVAPVITGPSGAATGNGTASGTATTTGTDGTMYAVRSAAQPTNAQIVAGQDSTSAASSAGSLAITSAGAKTIPLTGVAVPTGSQTVWFLHRPAAGAASDSNVVSAAWTQPTPATLSSPTNTPGSTTALVGCTTNTTSGTLYALARVGGSAASAATIVATGQTATVSTTTPSKTYTGLTASTSNYYVDMVQTSGVTTSNVVTTGPFTTSASGDTTAPTLTGSIVIGTVSSTTIQMSWPAGSDNVAVTSYEVSKNSGANWTDVGNVLTYTFTGLTASTSYGLRVRAKDAAGNVSTPALAATQSTSAAGGVGSINLNNAALYVFKKNNATTIASTSVTFWVSDVTTGALVGSAITGLSTDTSGLVTTAISNASMVAGTTYRLNYEFSSGEYGCVKLPAV